MRIMNRVLTLVQRDGETILEWEADIRHAELLIEGLGLGGVDEQQHTSPSPWDRLRLRVVQLVGVCLE